MSEKIFVNCSHETGKQMYFNDCSDDEDSANIDLEEEIEDENNCYKIFTEENEIRSECLVDAVSPGSYVQTCQLLEIKYGFHSLNPLF